MTPVTAEYRAFRVWQLSRELARTRVKIALYRRLSQPIALSPYGQQVMAQAVGDGYRLARFFRGASTD